jgi:hypothetical protein
MKLVMNIMPLEIASSLSICNIISITNMVVKFPKWEQNIRPENECNGRPQETHGFCICVFYNLKQNYGRIKSIFNIWNDAQ